MAKRSTLSTKATPATKRAAPKTMAEPAKSSGGRPRKPRPATVDGFLGEQVELHRKAKGWNATQLAGQAGIGTGTVYEVERGQGSPSLRTVVAIAGALGIKPRELLDGCRDW